MKYVYYIYESGDRIVANFEVNEPLPQIAEGHELLLNTDTYDPGIGRILFVRGVRVVISHLNGNFVRYDIHVVCTPQESHLRI
jgi:hypothetical protein